MRLTVKLGGSILEEPDVRAAILADITALWAEEHELILVHGGGKSLNRRLGQLGIASRFIGGLRVTDEATLSVAVMVLAGEVNKRLVAELHSLGVSAVGLCGADGGAVLCEPLAPAGDDLGFVGRPVSVNRPFFELLLGQGLVPVVSSIGLGPAAQLYNINADQAAAACAWGARCAALIYLTDVPGVKGSDGKVLRSLNPGEIEVLTQSGVLSGGMLPKTRSCLEALDRGVRQVYIMPGVRTGILQSIVRGAVTEGTCIHAHP